MENKSYTLEEVKKEANLFLNAKAGNINTYLSYRTSLNYFLYYLEHIVQVNKVECRNITTLIEAYQTSLFNGFTYEVESAEALIGFNEENFKPIHKEIKLSASGVNSNIRRIKTFFNKCFNIEVELKKLDEGEAKYKALKNDEVEKLIDNCSNKWKKEEIAIRNATLIRFLFNTGFRISEALGIKTNEIYEKNNGCQYVKIQEKGKRKKTEVRIAESDYEHIKEYISLKAVPSDFIFSTTKASEDGKAKKLSRQQFNRDVKALARYVDSEEGTNISEVVKNNSSHVFRHSAAINQLEYYTVDIMKVKKFLRHSSINSTQIYLNASDSEVDEIRINNILK